jgi:tetrapyrrole methylase family protein/MazG family protein
VDYTFEELVRVKEKLRSPAGCPWDRAQTLESMKGEMLEEAQEVADAIDKRDYGNLLEELGDLIGDALAMIQIAKEKGLFDESDVLKSIIEKSIRRHPHVFGSKKAETAEEAMRLWKQAKEQEKKK